jgi:hypothetical protein
MADIELRERLFKRIQRGCGEYGCWEWTGAHNLKGYGHVGINSKWHAVHRLMFESFCGLIEDGLEIHHWCENKRCCNPSHMLAVSSREHKKYHYYEGPKSMTDRPEPAAERYRLRRAAMSPEQLAAFNAHTNTLARERRKADPEHVRALERAKYVRRVARDPEGYRAKRRAIEVRYHQKKLAKHTGVVADFSDW